MNMHCGTAGQDYTATEQRNYGKRSNENKNLNSLY
jgi:hypothetical protein